MAREPWEEPDKEDRAAEGREDPETPRNANAKDTEAPEWVEITNCHSVLFPYLLSTTIWGRLLCEDTVELMVVFADGRVEYRDVPRAELMKRGFFCHNR